MRIKIGPFKLSPEQWRKLQMLPGRDDEERVMLALDAAIDAENERVAQRAETAAAVAKHVDELSRGETTQPKVAGVVSPPTMRALMDGARVTVERQPQLPLNENMPPCAAVDPFAFEVGPVVRCTMDDDGNLQPLPEETTP